MRSLKHRRFGLEADRGCGDGPVLLQERARRVVAALACGGTVWLGGCGGVLGDADLSAAQVRFVDVSPGSPEMDFYVNGAGAAFGLGYESFTSYLPVNAGPVNLAVTRSNLGQPMAGAQASLRGGHQYTAVVSHRLGSLQERIYPDQETAPPAGQMTLRVIDAMEGTGAMTVYVTPAAGAGSPMTLTVTPGEATAYVALPAEGSYLVTVAPAGHALSLPVANTTVRAVAEAAKTVIFAGAVKDGTEKGAVGFSLTDVDGR